MSSDISEIELESLIKKLNAQGVIPVNNLKILPQPEHLVKLKVPKLPNSNYPILRCWFNADHYAKENGGRVVFGWLLYKDWDFIQAQYHAIWTDNKGNYIDVTPDEEQIESIYFIPDNRTPFDYEKEEGPVNFWYQPSTDKGLWAIDQNNAKSNYWTISYRRKK